MDISSEEEASAWGMWRPDPPEPPRVETFLRSSPVVARYLMEGGYAGQEPNAACAMSLLRTPGYIEAIGAMHRASYRDQLTQLVRFRQSIAEEEEQEEEEVSNPSLDSEDACSMVKAPGTLGILRTPVGVLDSDAEEEARIMEDLDVTPQECLKDASLLPEIVFDEPEVLETVPGPPGSLTQGQNTPMVADAETLTSDIVSQQELRFESANFERFLISKGITKMVVRQAMESTDMRPRNRHAVFRLHVLRQYSGCLNSLEGLKPAEVSLLESLYPRPLPPLFEGGTSQFSNVAEMQAYVNRLNAELEQGAAALTPAVKAMPQVPLSLRPGFIGPKRPRPSEPMGPPPGRPRVGRPGAVLPPASGVSVGALQRENLAERMQIPFGGIEGARSKAAGPPLPFASAYPANILQKVARARAEALIRAKRGRSTGSAQPPTPSEVSVPASRMESGFDPVEVIAEETATDMNAEVGEGSDFGAVAQRARMTIAEARQELGLLPALTPATSLTAADIVEIFNPP